MDSTVRRSHIRGAKQKNIKKNKNYKAEKLVV